QNRRSVPSSSGLDERRREMKRLVLLVTVAALVGLGPSSGRAAEDYGPLKTMKTASGTVLTDAKGMTLYTFDKDTPGQPTGSGECAEYWRPAMAPKDAKPVGDLPLVRRADGTMQWADEGKPLYTYVSDKKPGDVTGDGKNGVWHVVKAQ